MNTAYTKRNRKTMAQYDVIIIGGGASGLMAAGCCGRRGLRTLVLERGERTGKKLLITGKGRCNVTNDCDVPTFMKNVPHNGKFLYGALNRFSPADTMAFFEGLGVPLKVERGNRVFPVSDKAGDVASALLAFAQRAGVEIVTGQRVTGLTTQPQGEFAVSCPSQTYFGKNVVLATGGLSYPTTGSTGDGYRFARDLGHSVTSLRPALVPLTVREKELCQRLQGLSLRNVTLTVTEEQRQKPIFSELGEMLFTHYGISGPLVLSASSRLEDPGRERYFVQIDLKPGLTLEQLDGRLLRDFSQESNKNFSNALGGLLPAKLIPVIIDRSGIPPEQKVHQINREQRKGLCKLLKAFPLEIAGFRPVEEAIITAGGIQVKEVNPKTMESKLVPGLYFAGEILDVDGYTGGFNLQIAFSTARAVGESVAASCEK